MRDTLPSINPPGERSGERAWTLGETYLLDERPQVRPDMPTEHRAVAERVGLHLANMGYSAISVVPEPPSWRRAGAEIVGVRFFFGKRGCYGTRSFKLASLTQNPRMLAMAIDRAWRKRFEGEHDDGD